MPRVELFAAVEPAQEQADYAAESYGAQDEWAGYRNCDPRDYYQAQRDDGARFCARDWDVAEA
jgi:hypothetical protein